MFAAIAVGLLVVITAVVTFFYVLRDVERLFSPPRAAADRSDRRGTGKRQFGHVLVGVIHADGNNCPPFWVPTEYAGFPVMWCPWCGHVCRTGMLRVPAGSDQRHEGGDMP